MENTDSLQFVLTTALQCTVAFPLLRLMATFSAMAGAIDVVFMHDAKFAPPRANPRLCHLDRAINAGMPAPMTRWWHSEERCRPSARLIRGPMRSPASLTSSLLRWRMQPRERWRVYLSL
ncbi:hypothetical protein E2562_008236 [Oryza meyeriana var. granulata]|uniref:Uncharacterized protein n=1 Tax=Oryza meyeriana var. granulata TaxID=110450 RepID=A0A6G1DFF4_9ORYZ|nr:hypothetical protein E2562_008236 [Oryza meyeriana var. granulata]